MIALNFGTVAGLTGPEQKALDELVRVYSLHQAGNAEKEKYYEGHVALKDVNLGIALPQGIRNLEVGCSWGQKAVDVLAARSMFDGFVSSGGDNAVLNRLIADNRLIAEYGKACRDELKYGCAFATLSADAAIGCKIRFHSPATAAALWSGEKGRIACGLAIIDTVPDEHLTGVWQPRVVNLYMDNTVTVLRRRSDGWNVQRLPHRMGRPLMEPLIWNATSGKPFGRSRLKRSIRTLIDDYIRTVANATIALEFDTTPQKYILGVTDEQYDVLISDKFKSYVGSLLAATSNPETGENPVFGQLAQGSLSPHTEKMRMTATQFAAATGLTVADVGVVNDANPTSSDAILAQSQTLVLLAQQLNTGNGDALRTIAQMAQAILRNVPPGALTEEERNVMPHFKNPAMPSVAVTADAAIKIATAREEFASTDTFLEMIGFDQADIRRIRAQEQRVRGQKTLLEVEDEDEPATQQSDKEVFIICGAPGSGKTTYASQHHQPGDLIVDVDTIVAALTGDETAHPDYENILDVAIAVRNTLYNIIENGTGDWKRAFVITSSMNDGAVIALAKQLHATVHYMETTKEECKRRIANDKTRQDKELFYNLVDEWFKNHELTFQRKPGRPTPDSWRG